MSDEVKHSVVWGLVILVIVCSLIWAIAYESVATHQDHPTVDGAALIESFEDGSYRIEGCIPSMPCEERR